MVRIPSFLSMEQFERRLEQPWIFFGLTALTVLMVAIDSTIVAVALPTLVRDLDTTLVLAAWTITAYALAQTVMLPMAGQLAEQFGQMRVFVACVSLFTVGSLLCALAPNVYALIVPRRWMTLLGLGLVFGAPVILRQMQMAAVLGVDFWLRDLIYSAAIKVSVLSRVVPVPSIEDLDAIYRAAGVLRAPAAPTSSVAVILQTFVSLVTYALIPSIGLMTFGLAVVVGMLAIVTAVRLVRLRPRVFLAGLHARGIRGRARQHLVGSVILLAAVVGGTVVGLAIFAPL